MKKLWISILFFVLFFLTAPSQAKIWTQANNDGFGSADIYNSECMAVYNANLYAGATKQTSAGPPPVGPAEIRRYDGGTAWTSIYSDWGGDTYTYGVTSMAVHNGRLYIGTRNHNTGAEVWEYDDSGPTWTQVNPDGFGSALNTEACSMAVFGGELYVGTRRAGGTQIWKYSGTGTTWTQENTNGFGDGNADMAFSMIEHAGKLHVGTNGFLGAKVWRYDGPNPTNWTQVNTTGFGNAGNAYVSTMAVHNEGLYAATANTSTGTEVWKYDGGTSWSQVNIDGFGTANVWYCMNMMVYDSNLYAGAGTAEAASYGSQIWRYESGTTWTKVANDGFGDVKNCRIYGMAVYGTDFYVGTLNWQGTGTEIWRYSDISPGTYYVNIDSGSDSNDGSAASPWKTLHHAIDQINAGSAGSAQNAYTLNVLLGTYSTGNGEENSELTISQNYVTIVGVTDGGSTTTISGTAANSWPYGIKITGSNVTLRNLYITGFTGTAPEGTGIEIVAGSNNTIENCRVYGNYDGISVSQSSNCTIQDCEIDNNVVDGISISESADSTITRNTIHDNYEINNSDGIIVQACSPEITRNTIYDNRFNISLQSDSGETTSPTIKNNQIYQVTSGEVTYGILMGGAGAASPKIYHNTIDGGSEDGINTDGAGNAPHIKYNIITGFGDYAVYNQNGSPVIDYNDAWNNSGGTYFGCVSPVPGDNNISANPQYTSYTLAVTSPCINAIPTGTPPNDPVTVDFDGNSRPYGSGYDMGCYENITLPAITTTAVSAISSTTALTGGNVASSGSGPVTARGVCWSTAANPTTSDSKTTDGTGTGTYTSNIMSLNTGTTYHVRAYATSAAGTAYGSDKTFTTSGPLSTGTYYVDIQNGSDSNDGTQAHPWKTLHHAVSEINGGTAGSYVIIMAAGSYSTGNGEDDSEITLSQGNVTVVGADEHTIGANNTTTSIDGTGAANWTKAMKITGSNVIIRGVSITNFSSIGTEITGGTENEVQNCRIFSNQRGIVIDTSSAFKIKGCDIYSNTNDGLYVEASTDGEIHRNIIYRHQSAGNNGVYVVNCSPSIKRNKIYDNDAGIRVKAYSGSTSVASPHISNNVIYETTDYTMNYGILVRGLDGTASPTITHNSIDGGTGDGIALERTSGTIQPVIKYNIVTNCDGGSSVGIKANTATGITCAPDYNDVWHNTENYDGSVCTAGTHDISQDPGNGGTGPLPEGSPCKDAIPTGDPPNDGATMDYLGYKRPKGSGFDMGPYEYIATQTSPNTLPGGTGIETDYRIFTIPLSIGTGLGMRNTMEGTLGSYDPTHWRVFARTTSGDIEMNTQAFTSLDIKPGMGFWIVTFYTNTINFQGSLSPDAIYYEIELAPGWHLFAVPWPNTSINLGKIYVTDGVNQYTITDASNTLTEKYIWDYTGTGATGYTVRNTGDFPLVAGTGYFIKVLGSSNIVISIPPNNSSDPPNSNSASTSHAMGYGSPQSADLPDDPEPPPLPGGFYGPMPKIRANGNGGSVTVPNGAPVSITVSLDPGDQVDKNADWWIVAHTPFSAPLDWYSYIYPEGWRPGIYPCVQASLFQVPPSFEVLDMVLPSGDYKFYFAVDENADGIVDETWVDSIDVRVE